MLFVQTEVSISQENVLKNIQQLDDTNSDIYSFIRDINPNTNNYEDISVILGTPEHVSFNISGKYFKLK